MPTRKPPSTPPARAPAVSLSGLTPMLAHSVGSTVGDLLSRGVSTGGAIDATRTLAEFVRRGQCAQAAIDTVPAAKPECRRTVRPKSSA